MAYSAWSVVFGEQPTAAKWNQLGTNDAGFKDGSNIDNDAILNRHITADAVAATEIDFSDAGVKIFAENANSISGVSVPYDCTFEVIYQMTKFWGFAGNTFTHTVNLPAGLTSLMNQPSVTAGGDSVGRTVLAKRIMTGGVKNTSYNFSISTSGGPGSSGTQSMIVKCYPV